MLINIHIGKLLIFGVKNEKKSIIQILETKNKEYVLLIFKKKIARLFKIKECKITANITYKYPKSL